MLTILQSFKTFLYFSMVNISLLEYTISTCTHKMYIISMMLSLLDSILEILEDNWIELNFFLSKICLIKYKANNNKTPFIKIK